MEEAEVARDDELVDEISPDPGLSGLVWIGGPEVGFGSGVNIFEEFENDMGVMEGSALIRKSGDEAFGVEGYVVDWTAGGWRGSGRGDQTNRTRDHTPRRAASLLKGLVSTYLYGISRSSRAIQHFWVNGQNF